MMQFPNKIDTNFNSLAQRLIYCYDICIPEPNYHLPDMASIKSQESMRKFLSDIVKTIYDDPGIIGINDEPDDAYEIFVSNNRKPELIKSMRRITKQLRDFYGFLYRCGHYGRIYGDSIFISACSQACKPKRAYLNLLLKVGVNSVPDQNTNSLSLITNEYLGMFQAWKLLTTNAPVNGEISGMDLFNFICGAFEKDHSYLLRHVERLKKLEYGFFDEYIERFHDRGFSCHFEYGFHEEGVFFDFSFLSRMSGFKISLAPKKIHQIIFSLASERGAKAVVEHYNEVSEPVRSFIDRRFYTCYDCRGCTKGGKNAKFAVPVVQNGKTVMLCPQSIWMGKNLHVTFNRQEMEAMCAFIDAQDDYGPAE